MTGGQAGILWAAYRRDGILFVLVAGRSAFVPTVPLEEPFRSDAGKEPFGLPKPRLFVQAVSGY